MSEPRQSEYDRGHAAGGIDERLKGVEAHLVRNNGSIAEQVAQMATVIKEIAALTAAVEHLIERRVEADSSLSRQSKLVLVLGALVIIAFTVGIVLIVTQ